MAEPERDEAFEDLLEFLRTSRGFDFTGYKRSSLMRRVLGRMDALGVQGFASYVDYLEVHQEEFTELFNFILINVTSFFRDPQVWEYLAEEVVPRIARATDDAPIRVWCAGCASGEEAYSIAMLFAERMGDDAFQARVKIYATDADDEAVAAARQGAYSAKAVEPVEPGRVERFFKRTREGFEFRRDLRHALVFGRHDLVQDAPISKTDLISCRNTLMYLNAETQAHVLDRFRFSLNPDGLLLLGKSEMLFTRIPTFVPVDVKRRVFAKEGSREHAQPAPPWAVGPDEPQDGTPRLSRIAFQEAAVAQILVSPERRLLMANRRASLLFGLRQDDLGRPLEDLDVSERPADLRGPIEETSRTRETVKILGVRFGPPGEPPSTFDVEVASLDGPGGQQGIAVSFVDVSEARQLQRDVEESNQELETAMEELQSTNEELETTNEELQSTNEELETTNEELQSTNEELQTVNEELQSTNEELRAVNLELDHRSREVTGLNGFLASILGGVRAGVVVLDADLRVRMWNRASEDLWGLRYEEVRGQPFLNLDVGLPLEPVRKQIRRVLAGDPQGDTLVVDATNRRGRGIRCRITCSRFDDDGARAGVILLMESDDAGGVSPGGNG